MRLLRYIFQLIFIDSFLLNFIPALILVPAGIFLIPLAMLWRYEDKALSFHPTHQSHWKYVRLPRWAQIWEGEHGLMGDGSRINTHTNPGSFLAMWDWAAIRNPLGGWDRLVAGFHLNSFDTIEWHGSQEVDDVSGKFGWHFVITHGASRTVTGFYGVWRISDEKCFRLRIGYKVKPSYQNSSRNIDATPLSVSIKGYKS